MRLDIGSLLETPMERLWMAMQSLSHAHHLWSQKLEHS
ncbi:hypothetical protein LINPERHAP2_LOCUS21984 [Linum perenne]